MSNIVISKTLKNDFNGIRKILGKNFNPYEVYEVPGGKWLELFNKSKDADSNIYSWLNDETLKVSKDEGDTYLSKSDGIEWCRLLSFYDNSNPPNIIKGLPFQAVFLDNGSTGNEWLCQYDANIPSNQSPYVVPFDCRLVGITYSNSKDEVDSDIEIWVSALGDGTTKTRVFNWERNNKRVGYKTDFDPYIEFDAGDKVSVYNDDKGKNASDTVVILYFQAINNNVDEEWEDYSGD